MDTAAARLLLQLPSGRRVSLPVPRQACLGLTRAVVFVTGQLARGRAGPTTEATGGEDWRDACWRLAGASPPVATWLAAAERGLSLPAVAGGGRPEQRLLRLWLERLRADLVTPASPQAGVRLRAVQPVSAVFWSGLLRGHRPALAEPAAEAVPRAIAGSWLELLDRWSARPEAAAAAPASGASEASLDGEADPAAVLLEETIAGATAVEGLASDFEVRVATARLDAIRELAYGAGHEINNPLANIAARAQALLPDESDPERCRRLATIVDQAFRARDMIGGLMIFARPPRPQPSATAITEVVTRVVESLLPAAENRGVRLVFSPPPAAVTVLVDRNQVEDSLRAVVLNGIESITGGGTVAIETTSADRPEGRCCLVTVTDNGAGMSRETVERMFDPFFSGREAGRGIGLGLSKALRLIDANGGRIAVASRPRQGTTVSITLPLVVAGP